MSTRRRTTKLYGLIRSFEGEEHKSRNVVIKIADRMTAFFGSLEFFLANITVFTVWVLINTGHIPGIPVFDPYPFILLITLVSLEAIILTTVVLMSQHRQSQIAMLRDELQLQINLIAEKEITKILKLLCALNKEHKISNDDPELKEMLEDLDESYIERKLKEELLPEKQKFL